MFKWDGQAGKEPKDQGILHQNEKKPRSTNQHTRTNMPTHQDQLANTSGQTCQHTRTSQN